MGRIRSLTSGGMLLTIALLIGAGTAVFTFGWANSRGGERQPARPTVSVVVARDSVPAGVKLTASLLNVRHVDQELLVAGALGSVDLAAGRTLRYPLAAGEQVGESKLVSKNVPNGDGLAFSVPTGYRALSVSVDEVSSAGGLIMPGDRVDVMVSTTYERLFGPGATPAVRTDDAGRPVVMTILQDMLVLAVGQVVTERLDDDRDPATLRPGNAEAQPKARSVTLAVQPTQSQVLFMAAQQGKIGLALRPYAESTQQALDPAVRLEAAGAGTIRQVSR